MKKIACLLTLLFTFLAAQAQNVDSLINVLNTSKISLEEQSRICRILTDFYVGKNPKVGLFYAKKGLEIAERQKNGKDLCWFSTNVGFNYERLGIVDTAMMYLEKALSLADNTKKGQEDKAWVYGNMGNIYYRKNNKIAAIECFMKVKVIASEIDNKLLLFNSLVSIAGIHRAMYDHDKAIDYYEQAKLIAKERNDSSGMCDILYGLGSVHGDRKERDKALKYYSELADVSKSIGNVKSEILSMLGLSRIYKSKEFNDIDKALKYVSRADTLAEIYGDPRLIAASKELQAGVYCDLGRYKEAEKVAFMALESNSSETGIVKRNILAILINVYIFLDDKEKASKYFIEYDEFTNQYNERSFHEAMTDMEVKYETEKKEMRITSLEKEKKLYTWLGIAGAVALLLVFGMLFFRHRANVEKRKAAERQQELAEQRIKQLEQEQQLVATKAVLDSEVAERSRFARDLHDGIGGMLNVVKKNLSDMKGYVIVANPDAERFSSTLDVLDSSISELRRVAHHMMPDSLMRYGLKTSLEDYSKVVPNLSFRYVGENVRLDSRLEVMIYNSAYELISNAVKYANATAINVQLLVDNGLVSLTVQDNGAGFDPNKLTDGSGLDNIRMRVSAYNGKLHIHSSPGKGTEVNIEIENSSTIS